MKRCSKCKKEKDRAEFHKQFKAVDGLHIWCKSCESAEKSRYYRENKEKIKARVAKWESENKDKVKQAARRWRKDNADKHAKSNLEWYHSNFDRVKDRRLQKAFGMTLQRYNEMLEEQDHKCAICGRSQRALSKAFAVDHDHDTGRVRGLLCDMCNRAIGLLGDDIERLNNAINYLKQGDLHG